MLYTDSKKAREIAGGFAQEMTAIDFRVSNTLINGGFGADTGGVEVVKQGLRTGAGVKQRGRVF